MKTIEERAKSYARKVWRGGSRDFVSHKKATELDFIAGAQSEREELTRWYNPKDKLPEPLKDVLVKCSDGTYLVDMFLPTPKKFHCEAALYGEVLGWRPILETE